MVWPAILVGAVVAVVSGSPARGPSENTKSENSGEPKYDAATLIRISGTIVDVREISVPAALPGLYLTVRTDKTRAQVYLCPAEYLQRFQLKFRVGEEVQISGSKVRFAGADVVLARDMRRHNDVVVFRDDEGRPYWEDQFIKGTSDDASARQLNQLQRVV
jgi:hypothetical protein